MVTLTEKPRAEVVHFKMDSALDIITRVVMDDEPCYMLAELNLPTDKGRKCRFQILRIVRNDHLETAYVNLGPAADFQADQIAGIQGGWVENGKGRCWDTVANLRAIAERMRNEPLHREVEPLKLQEGFLNMVEEKKKKRAHLSTFGPGGQKVRT